MLQMGDCNNGLRTDGAAYIRVTSGSISSIVGAAFIFGNCSSASLEAVRMEESNIFAVCRTSTPVGQFTITNCMMHQRSSLPTETIPYVNGWKCLISLTGPNNLSMRNNILTTSMTNDAPILYAHNSPGGALELIQNCCNLNGPLFSGAQVGLVRLGDIVPSSPPRIYARDNSIVLPVNVFVGWYPNN